MGVGLDMAVVTIAEASARYPRHGGADLIELDDGSLYMVRMRVRASDLSQQAGDDAPSDLIVQRSSDGGHAWTEPQLLIEPQSGETAAYCPGLLRLRSGGILFRYEMYHRFVKGEPWSISAYATFSHDECESFGDPIEIWSRSSHHCGSQGDLRELSSGRIIVPTMYMCGTALQDDGQRLAPTNTATAGTFYSDDHGRTWRECRSYAYLPMRGCMEPKVEQLKDGRLLMVMRTQLGGVFQSISYDGGETWSDPQTTGLAAPESCPGLRRIPQTGDLMLVYNASPYDPRFDHYGLRSPLSIAISRDDGRTWGPRRSIESDPEWEYTNPAIVVTHDGRVVIVYEASRYESVVHPGKLGRSRMHLKAATFDLDWLYS